MNKRLCYLLPGVLLVAAAACTDTGPTGAAAGDAAAEVRVNGDAPEAAASDSRAPSTAEESAAVEGSVEVRARVYLQTDAGAWVELTQDAAGQTVKASGEDGFKLLARSEIEATSYQRVRVEFESVRGELDGGVAISVGGGNALVHVDVGSSGSVTVERAVELNVEPGSTSRLDIDLNTALWASESSTSGVVSESAFASAVSVTAR